MSGIQRLHPHLQHGIVNDLGWRSLRPVQDLSIDAVLDGCNAVVLAPTAGGKTEAAMFPVLSRILTEGLRPVSALYLCPIRALLNNQEDRLSGYARMVGLEVFKWHGDVSDARKSTFRQSPSHILMTTPESLEVMMMSARTDARALFAGLSVVVIDEVHAFAGDDRGAHLAALLERLSVMCARDVQRLGLSATVGNPHVIGQWLQGSSKRPFRLVDPPKPKAERQLHVDFGAELADAAKGIVQIARGKKSLVFVESRSKAERVAQALGGSGVEVFIHHSSVSRQDRALAEQQFASGQNTAIVCTSTMELGIDVGDLDQVIQVDAPASVASFLQRLGRTGRRAATRPNCTFFCLSTESLLQSLAILRLAEAGWVEDVRPAGHAMHVLAHQVLALVLQEGGLSRHRILPWIEDAYPFSTVGNDDFQELVDTMVERDILYEADGQLSLGRRGEKLYGRKNFFELYAVFTAAPAMRVQHGKDDVGYIQSLFVSMHDRNQGPLSFRLAGRAWEVGQIDWSKGVLHVRPAEHGRVPSWLGLPGTLSARLCGAMRDVLQTTGGETRWLSRGAALELASVRQSYEELLSSDEMAPLEEHDEGITWHTFAGGAANRLISFGLERLTGKKWVAGNLSIRCKEIAGAAARLAISELPTLTWEGLAASAARNMTKGMISKFQPCLPEAAENRLLAERLLDLPATLEFLKRLRPSIASSGAPRLGQRLADVDVEISPDHLLGAVLDPRARAVPRNPIAWVRSAAELRGMCDAVRQENVVGLDVETTIDVGAMCLIQVATGERTWMVDVLVVDDLTPLAEVMSSARPLKIIHHANFERRAFASHGIELNGVFDTLEASRVRHGPDVLGGHSLAMVCERELGLVLDKSEQSSDWTRRPLSAEQIAYAALDAEVLIALHERLAAGARTTE